MKIIVDGLSITMLENTLAQSINTNLGKFIEEEMQLAYHGFFSRDGDQNFADLDKYCGDLVGTIGGVRAIVLEVKLKEGNQLPAYDEDQHRALSALEENNVPVHYCYNGYNLRVGRPSNTDVNSYLACEPSNLGGKTPKSAEHETLGKVAESLVNSGKGGFDEAVYSLAVLNICSDLTFELSQMTAKCLLLLYSQDLRKICLLDHMMAERLVRTMQAKKFTAQNKGSDEFFRKLEEFSSTLRQALHTLEHPDPKPSQEDDSLYSAPGF
ncbi:hypothetical protein [Janthinobacterium sp. NKUCC06_STL]|uniref:hypothetical protein n=1 Tax=Janthinobacterium sp. NKUCC06_STL TaxID=2842127 RepID=UPI001C5BCCA6|nr:hypothetical protein [Janthinobacterium sp. NKUCC06_STL]MBW3510620.1 hypothetical protein [Janthinobacterium sp. NKUCC06_STL]